MPKKAGATVRATYLGTAVMIDLTEVGRVLRTDRRCRVAVMVKNVKWIMRVRILCVMLEFVLCVIDAGILLVNAQKTNRDTVVAAAVVQASAQISVIRATVRRIETSMGVKSSHLAGRGLSSRTARRLGDKSVSRTVYQPLVNGVEVGYLILLMIVRQPVQFVITAVDRVT